MKIRSVCAAMAMTLTMAAVLPSVAVAQEGIFEGPLIGVDTSSSLQVADATAAQLLFAIDSLVELGAFSNADPNSTELLNRLAESVPGFGGRKQDYRIGLEIFRDDWPILLDALDDTGVEISGSALLVEIVVESNDWDDVLQGGASLIDGDLWLRALADLVLWGGEGNPDSSNGWAASLDQTETDAVLSYAGFFSGFAFGAPGNPGAEVGAGTVVDELATEPQPAGSGNASNDAAATVSDIEGAVASEQDAAQVTVGTDQDAVGEVDPADATGTDKNVKSASPEAAGPTTAMLLAAGIAVLIVLGFVLGLLRRRSVNRATDRGGSHSRLRDGSRPTDEQSQRSVPSTHGPSGPSVPLSLLEASRRMTVATSAVEIADIALVEAKLLVEATAGFFVVPSEAGPVALSTDADAEFGLEPSQVLGVGRVLETGQATTQIDSAVGPNGTAKAILLVPVVTKGSIAGVLALARAHDRPFARTDIETLEVLAPLVGSALSAAADREIAAHLVDVEPMTGLKNRRCLDRDLAEINRGSMLSYFMIDVDNFKNFNDTNGHAAGDGALRSVANLLAQNVRPGDVVYRYGGEEFCVLLPGTEAVDARMIAERLRVAIESADIAGGESQPGGRVTVSIGVADTSDGRPLDLVERADAALYAAKHAGRNQVRLDESAN